MAEQRIRTEHDSMGAMEVPADAYYGAQTARAVANFPISGQRFSRRFIAALGNVKVAATRANARLGVLPADIAGAIESAAREVAVGRLDDHFVVDVFQTGSGTSTNMNANEVIARRAAEILGAATATIAIHPNDHVNASQSSNDVFPTAIHVAALTAVEAHVLPAMNELAASLAAKAEEFRGVVKAGRTHLQDAVPVTLGQEFSGYASVVRHGVERIGATRAHLAEVPIGGTALGTGLNAPPDFADLAVAELCELTGLRFRRAENCFEAMQNRDACVELSGAFKVVAIGLMKLGNDLRLLASGPATGLREIHLPAIQPGSSIMPGKINPVLPEAVNMVAAQVIGNDTVVSVAAMNGNLDLNTMMPVIAANLLASAELLGNACRALAEKCVRGITADRERCLAYAERSSSLVTALAPLVGYEAAARIFTRSVRDDVPIRQAILESGMMEAEKIDEILDLERLTRGGRAG